MCDCVPANVCGCVSLFYSPPTQQSLDTLEPPSDQLHHANSMSNISTDRSSVDSTMLKNSFVSMATSVHHELAEVLKQMEEEQKRCKEVTVLTLVT